ncbi:MAG: 3-isopropylmalate dehydratase small subunit [Treponema sp.]|nr:3-isopropylmalate dehydratase small subunit [Treponema sp.]
MKKFGGSVLFLDRSNINTDEIIPAKYLNENSKDALKPYLLEDLRLPGFDPKRDIAGKGAVVSRANFGCGSSREHAPWALEANGINVVIAESFARIFRQNMFNCGMMALELSPEALDGVFRDFGAFPSELAVDAENGVLVFSDGEKKREFSFNLGEFETGLVRAGGWVQYAAQRY